MVHLLDIYIKIVLQFIRSLLNSSVYKHNKGYMDRAQLLITRCSLDISYKEPIKTFGMKHKSTKRYNPVIRVCIKMRARSSHERPDEMLSGNLQTLFIEDGKDTISYSDANVQ